MSFSKKIWETLSSINVNTKVEKKNGFSYLSWAWAWQVLMENFPESTYTIHEEKYFSDGTCEVGVTVTITENENSLSRFMWLPVIDYRNEPIKNPNAFAISKNKMRCLVKCLAMFGLGAYIYAGEDLPESEKPKPKSYTDFKHELNSAETFEELKQVFAEAWKTLCEEEKAKINDIYQNRKADFESAESESA